MFSPRAAAAAETVAAMGGTWWDKLGWRGPPLGVPKGLVGTDVLAGTAWCSDVVWLVSAKPRDELGKAPVTEAKHVDATAQKADNSCLLFDALTSRQAPTLHNCA